MRDSDVPKLSSSLPSSAWSPAVSTRPPTTPSWSVTWTSGRTCTPTLFSQEAPPCTPVSLTECRRRSPPWPPAPWRSRSSLHQRGSTLSGSEDPSWPPSPPSSRCGSPSRSTTSLAHPLSTGSVSKHKLQQLLFYCILTPTTKGLQCIFYQLPIITCDCFMLGLASSIVWKLSKCSKSKCQHTTTRSINKKLNHVSNFTLTYSSSWWRLVGLYQWSAL